MSFGVPAKPGIAKDFIEANDIDRKAVLDFIDSLLVVNYFLQPHKMLQANKVLRLACQERIVQFTQRHQPDKRLKERLWSA